MAAIISFIKRLLGHRRQKKNTPSFAPNTLILRHEHNISKTDISDNALKVLNRLHSNQFDAYLVGGGVRDLLLRQKPKDFDVVTDAKPNQVKRLFKNCRLIGRRFRLAHILFYRDIIEVATFRAGTTQHDEHKTNDDGMIVRDNAYGTITDDAFRRDFTINALYYNIADFTIVDFTGGFRDIKNKTIRIIGDAATRYQEDPVRMLRAIRFAAKLDFRLEEKTKEPIQSLSHLIKQVANSRLFDEITKLYHCGNALSVQSLLNEYQLFPELFPLTHQVMLTNQNTETLINHMLENTDSRINQHKPVTPAFFYAVLLWHPLMEQMALFEQEGTPPLIALEKAMGHVLIKQNQITSIPKRFTQAMREMWLLQFRFAKRFGPRPHRLLEHPRFRAAYDFLLLRALTGEAPVELADWWTDFQEADDKEKRNLLNKVKKKNLSNKKTNKNQ